MWWMPLAKESVRNLFLWSYIHFSWTTNPWSPDLKSTGIFLGKKKENKICPKQFCFLTQKVFKNPTSSPIFSQAKCLVTSQENIKAMQRTAIKVRRLTYHKGSYLPHELKQARLAVPITQTAQYLLIKYSFSETASGCRWGQISPGISNICKSSRDKQKNLGKSVTIKICIAGGFRCWAAFRAD